MFLRQSPEKRNRKVKKAKKSIKKKNAFIKKGASTLESSFDFNSAITESFPENLSEIKNHVASEEEIRQFENEYLHPLMKGEELWARYTTNISMEGPDCLYISPEALLATAYRIKKKHLEYQKNLCSVTVIVKRDDTEINETDLYNYKINAEKNNQPFLTLKNENTFWLYAKNEKKKNWELVEFYRHELLNEFYNFAIKARHPGTDDINLWPMDPIIIKEFFDKYHDSSPTSKFADNPNNFKKLDNFENDIYPFLRRTQGAIRADAIAITYNRIFGKNYIFSPNINIEKIPPHNKEDVDLCISYACQLHEELKKDPYNENNKQFKKDNESDQKSEKDLSKKDSKSNLILNFNKLIYTFNDFIKNKKWTEKDTPQGNTALSSLEFKNWITTKPEFNKLRNLKNNCSDKSMKTNIDVLLRAIYHAKNDEWFDGKNGLKKTRSNWNDLPKLTEEAYKNATEREKYDDNIISLKKYCEDYKNNFPNLVGNLNKSEVLQRHNDQIDTLEALLEKIEKIDWPTNSYKTNQFEARLDPISYSADRGQIFDNHKFMMKKINFTLNDNINDIDPNFKGITILKRMNENSYSVYDKKKNSWTPLVLSNDEKQQLDVPHSLDDDQNSIMIENKRLSSTLIDKLAPSIDLRNQLQPYLFPSSIVKIWSSIRQTKANPIIQVGPRLKDIAMLALQEYYKKEKNTEQERDFFEKIADLIDIDQTFKNIIKVIKDHLKEPAGQSTNFKVTFKNLTLKGYYVPEGVKLIYNFCKKKNNATPKEKLKNLLNVINKANDKIYNFSFSSFFRDPETLNFYKNILNHNIVLKTDDKLKDATNEIVNFTKLEEVNEKAPTSFTLSLYRKH